jgi:hypothetical protein
MSKPQRAFLMLASFPLVAVALGVLAVAWHSRSTYRYEIAAAGPLTEEVVLDRARAAIGQAGYDPGSVEPVCYRQPCATPEPYFARNTIEPNSGYVLWRFKSNTRTLYQLSVSVERKRNQLRCTVGEVK